MYSNNCKYVNILYQSKSLNQNLVLILCESECHVRCKTAPVGIHAALCPAVHFRGGLERGVALRLLQHGTLGVAHPGRHEGALRGGGTTEPAVRLLTHT